MKKLISILAVLVFATSCKPNIPILTMPEEGSLRVSINGLSFEHYNAMSEAIDKWNQGLGRDYIKKVTDNGPRDVNCFTKNPPPPMLGSYSPFWKEINIHEDVTGCYAKSTTLHELGHALGLSHSDEIDDVMYPSTAGECLELTKNDIERAKKKLGL